MCEQCVATLKVTDYTKTVNGKPIVMTYEGTSKEIDNIFRKSFSDTIKRELKGKAS